MSATLYHRLVLSLLLLPAGIPVLAQENGKDSLMSAFSRYRAQTSQEKLFAHIDRTFYLAGETIWFKLYGVEAGTNRPLATSEIAYIEILDKDQRPVLQSKIEIRNGNGDGAFSIPLTIASGEYLFRAYTNWMKNFSPDLYYMQPLTILNTLTDRESDTTIPALSATLTSSAPANPATIRFFPEGGNLVNGIISTVAVKASGRRDNPISCDGIVIDQKNDTIARFHTGPDGIGIFNFTPALGNTYTATTSIDQAPVTQLLPNAWDRGYVMHLDDDGSHHLHIKIQTGGTIPNPVVYLFTHTHGKITSVQMNFLANGQTSFDLDKDSLDDGISHLTVFNGDRVPVCERLYFKQPKQRLTIAVSTTGNASSSPTTPDPTFQTRRHVSIDLFTTDNHGAAVPADLSLAAFRLDSLQSIPSANILTWLLLSSELKGRIDWPQGNPWDTEPAATKSLDNLMLTQGWSRYRWEDILSARKPMFDFLPETNGPIVMAKVIDKVTGRPPASVVAYLSIPGQHPRFATTNSQPDGNLYFHLENFYGSKNLVVQTNSQKDSNCRIDIANPWSDRYAAFPLYPFAFSMDWFHPLLQRSIEAQAENAYRSAQKHRYDQAAEDTLAFYGASDLNFNLDDYTRFATMEETIQEFVDNVHIRRKSGHAYFRVRNALINLFFDDDPLLLIDGIPVFNADKLIAMDPAKIRRVEVVSHKYILGPSITDGIVNFRSFEGDIAGYELDPNAVALQFNGLDLHREFYTPVYNGGNQGLPSIPDLRNELLWAPNIQTGTTGKQTLPLYTSDQTGKFALLVQGITKDGLAGYSIVTFSVGQ